MIAGWLPVAAGSVRAGSGVPEKTSFGRQAQADRLEAQLADPLLLVVGRRDQHQDRLAGRRVAQPVLDAQHADHRLAAAGGRLDQLALVAAAAKDRVRLVLVRARIGRVEQIGVAPGARLGRARVEQRRDRASSRASAVADRRAGDLVRRSRNVAGACLDVVQAAQAGGGQSLRTSSGAEQRLADCAASTSNSA